MPGRTSAVRRQIFVCLASALWLGVFCAALAADAESLKGLSSAELLHLVIGGKDARRMEHEAEIRTHLPEDFRELTPRAAALALAQSHCPAALVPKLRFFIDARDDLSPPAKGEVGLRWSCSHCYLAGDGMTILRNNGAKSAVAYSRVKVLGYGRDRPSDAAIRRAVDKVTTLPLRVETARHLYEVIWWLGKVRAEMIASPAPDNGGATTERIVSTGDAHADFWVTPPQKKPVEATLYSWPLSGRYGNEFNIDLHASFTQFLFSHALKEAGADLHDATSTIGREEPLSEAEKFLKSAEKADLSKEEQTPVVNRMLKLLENPKGTSIWSVIWALVPFEAPMRFPDPRIDAALLRVLRRATTTPETHPDSFEVKSDAARAASALGWRECAEALPILLKLLELKDSTAPDNMFEALAHIAGRHPESRRTVMEFLEKRLPEATGDHAHNPNYVFDTIWRGDLRDFESALEQRATSTPEEMEDPGSWHPRDGEPPPRTGRFHIARTILAAWREPDPLTRLKINLVLQASSNVSARPPRFLRDHYRELYATRGEEIRQFVATMEGYPMPYNWTPDRLHESLTGAE